MDASSGYSPLAATVSIGHYGKTAQQRREQGPSLGRALNLVMFAVGTAVRRLDAYSWRARVQPVLLTALPCSLLGLAWLPSLPNLEKLLALVVASGFPILADQLGRSWGKRVEQRLFAEWGGKPTTQLLRWNGPISKTRQTYQHALLQEVVGPSLPLPTEREEAADPASADEVYELAAEILRSRVRDRPQATLVRIESHNYGFRRNLLGLRPLGLASVTASLLIVVALLVLDAVGSASVNLASAALVGLVDVLLLWLWLAVVSKRWVEEAAWAYAEQLIAETRLTDASQSLNADPESG